MTPDFVPPDEWPTLVKYAEQYGTDPYLLAAIGKHETGFGTLGKGRQGYTMGYGVTAPNPTKWQGLEKQAEATAKKLGSTIGRGVTPETLYSFAAEAWKPDPGQAPESYQAWARSVYSIYSAISGSGHTDELSKPILPKNGFKLAPKDYTDPDADTSVGTTGEPWFTSEDTGTGGIIGGLQNIGAVWVTGILVVLVGIGTFLAFREGLRNA